MRASIMLLTIGWVLGASTAFSSELPEIMPLEQEIALAESAGPAHIATEASIYVLRRGGFELARDGDNGFACLVTRHDTGSMEPQCFDPEGVRSLLPVALERARLLESGVPWEDVDRVIGEGFVSGKFRAPQRGGVTYMLSTENRVFNGERIINYPPHVMIMAPYVTNADIGSNFSDSSMPWVLNEGKPSAYIMVVVNRQAEEHEHE